MTQNVANGAITKLFLDHKVRLELFQTFHCPSDGTGVAFPLAFTFWKLGHSPVNFLLFNNDISLWSEEREAALRWTRVLYLQRGSL